MSYVVNKTNGQTLTIIADGTLDTSIGLFLVGRNYRGYGEFTAENFVRLAENFANSTAPNAPLEGQLWWNTQTKILNVYQGTQFKSILSGTIGAVQPPQTNSVIGDFWWNTNTNQLFINSGTTWILVGPPSTSEIPGTSIEIVNLKDTSNLDHPAILFRSNFVVVAIISSDPEYTLLQPINTLFQVKPGINLTASNKLLGTASNSEQLGGFAANLYIRTNANSQVSANIAIAEPNRISFGLGDNLQIYSRNNSATIESLATDINFRVVGNNVMTISSVDSRVSVAQQPLTGLHVANKSYVDQTALATLTSSNSYTNTLFAALKGNPPLTLGTLENLALAINNDPSYASTVNLALSQKANLASPVFTGNPRAPTPNITDNSTSIATTAFVRSNIDEVNLVLAQKANLVSPAFTGFPVAPTPVPNDNSTRLATTEYVTTAINNIIPQVVIPGGVIVMWAGLATNVPAGWALCDGTNGTPDLRNKFIIGAGVDFGGESNTTVTGSPTKTGGSKDAVAVSHTHTATTTVALDGAHAHNINTVTAPLHVTTSFGNTTYDIPPNSGSGTPKVISTATAGSHTHTATTTVSPAGVSGVNANLPPYYALAYIMKL
ncbi:MAG: phage tail protein [Fischerella sp.]|nr:phage tail protein [Fischerella sp.]